MRGHTEGRGVSNTWQHFTAIEVFLCLLQGRIGTTGPRAQDIDEDTQDNEDNETDEVIRARRVRVAALRTELSEAAQRAGVASLTIPPVPSPQADGAIPATARTPDQAAKHQDEDEVDEATRARRERAAYIRASLREAARRNGGLFTEMRNSNHIGSNNAAGASFNARNFWQELRNAVLAFRDAVNDITENDDEGKLSISEAILLLNRAKCEIGQALRKWKGHRAAQLLLDRVHGDFLEPTTLEDDDDQPLRDARLAKLLEVTARPDWHSLSVDLENKKWNIIESLCKWYKKGIVPVGHKDDKAGKSNLNRKHGEGWGRRLNWRLERLPMPPKA